MKINTPVDGIYFRLHKYFNINWRDKYPDE